MTDRLKAAAATLVRFNEASDAALEVTQPAVAEFVALLKTLRAEVAAVNARAAKCVKRARQIAVTERVELSSLRLGQHDAELEREEKAELVGPHQAE